MTIFDAEAPLSEEELIEVREYAAEYIAVWRKRFLCSTVALLLSCASVYPFLAGHTLHKYWESFGKYLVLSSMALLVVWVYCTGMFWHARQALRDVEKGET